MVLCWLLTTQVQTHSLFQMLNSTTRLSSSLAVICTAPKCLPVFDILIFARFLLTNFARVTLYVEDIYYPTAEHSAQTAELPDSVSTKQYQGCIAQGESGATQSYTAMKSFCKLWRQRKG